MAAKLRKRDCYGDGGGLLSLPEDIILDVLLRLPSKDLYRLCCVSRSWRALISHPAIVAALRSRTTGTIILAVFGNQLRLLDKGGNVLMWFDVPGCKGLLVPTSLDGIFVDRGQFGAVFIDLPSGCNFTVVGTNDIEPPLPSELKSPVISDYSFGRAAASGDYKVLRLATYLSHRWCQVTTIRDGDAELTWRQRPPAPFYRTWFSWEDKATINGILYFMLYYTESHGRNFVAAFDLESEEWKPRMIEGPLLGHKNKDDRWRITLTELKGTLCIVHNVQYLSDLVCHYADIWLLKDSIISYVWVKEYKIKMMPQRLLSFTKPLNVLIDGTLLLLNKYRNAGNAKNCHRYMLQLYNASTKALTDFMEMAPGFNGGTDPPIITCIRRYI